MKPPILSVNQIEERADEFLIEYTRITGNPIVLPVPIEKVILQVLDIPVEWEPIPTNETRQIISKFVQPTITTPARIILNENLVTTKLDECPGLENTALAHEAGHAIFHNERSLSQQLALTLPLPAASLDSDLNVFADRSQFAQALQALGPSGDDWWREWQAHTFMRFVLMPRRLLLPFIEEQGPQGPLTWPFLYRLRERLAVTISALVVHLEKLGIMRIIEGRVIRDLRLYRDEQSEFRMK
ncbi:hypothetical protein BH23CHL1_BH23CHL1_16760 [soil metagenome]